MYPLQREQQLRTVIQRLGLPATAPVNLQLLDHALTHPNFDPQFNYEQLEFIGDSVVRLLASEVLMNTYPEASVGDYSAIRSVLVSDRVLAEWGELYGLARYVRVAGGASTHSQKFVRLADVFEAVLGALYRSTGDMTLITAWLTPLLRYKAEEVRSDPVFYNYKDALQEWTQAQFKVLPRYCVEERELAGQAPATERFQAQVWLHNDCLGQGQGPTKKAAEQAAARVAYLAIQQTASLTSG